MKGTPKIKIKNEISMNQLIINVDGQYGMVGGLLASNGNSVKNQLTSTSHLAVSI